jgi:hypothetical protein
MDNEEVVAYLSYIPGICLQGLRNSRRKVLELTAGLPTEI